MRINGCNYLLFFLSFKFSFSVEIHFLDFRFSKANFIRIRESYKVLDLDSNGLLSLDEMTNFQRLTNTFIQRFDFVKI